MWTKFLSKHCASFGMRSIELDLDAEAKITLITILGLTLLISCLIFRLYQETL